MQMRILLGVVCLHSLLVDCASAVPDQLLHTAFETTKAACSRECHSSINKQVIDDMMRIISIQITKELVGLVSKLTR